MAVFPPGRGSQRRPSMRGNLLQDVVRGVERNRAWPSKRLSNQTPEQKKQTEWFRQANWAFKYMAPDIQEIFRKATHLTSLYPRDLFSIMASGGLAFIAKENGKKYFPMATKLAVSESLDAISQVPGYTLIRGPQFWQAAPVAPGPASLTSRIGLTADTPVLTGARYMPFNTASINDLGAWSPAQPGRLIVPAGVKRVETGATIRAEGGNASNVAIQIRKNGIVIASQQVASGFTDCANQVSTGPINVVPGDIIQLYYYFGSPSSKTIRANETAMWMKWG